MLKSWRFYLFLKRIQPIQDRKQGFTLVELILSLAISAILIASLYSTLNFTINTCKLGEEVDEIMLNGQYAIDQIKREIRQAEKIISVDRFEGLDREYKDNLGFVVMKYYPKDDYQYNYSTYYFKNNRLYRIAKNRKDDTLPKFSSLDGHNVLVEYVESIEGSNINLNSKTIDLNFVLRGEIGEAVEFRTKIFIRCPVIY